MALAKIKKVNPEHQDELGRFKTGNKAGNHYINRRYHEIKTLIHKNVTDDEIVDIVKTCIAQAKDGDGEARKWLFERLIGKPKEQDDMDTTTQGWNIVINVAEPPIVKAVKNEKE